MNECPRNCSCPKCVAERNKNVQKFMKFRDIVASYDPTGELISEGFFKKLVKALSMKPLASDDDIKQTKQKKTRTPKEKSIEQTNKLLSKSLERSRVKKEKAEEKERIEKEGEREKQEKLHRYAYPEAYATPENPKGSRGGVRAPRSKKISLPLTTSTEFYKPFEPLKPGTVDLTKKIFGED